MTSDENRDNVFHERAGLLKDQSYQGFTVKESTNKWDGVQITAQNNSGETITAWGETMEEAYQNMVDNIDQGLDEQR